MLKTAPAMPIAFALLLPACATPPPPPRVTVVEPPVAEWETLILPEDRARLDRLGATWAAALAAAQSGRRARAPLDRALVDPDGAVAPSALTPGAYRCRTVRFGAPAAGEPAYRAFRPFFCHVDASGRLFSFTKQTGSDLPAGWLYPDGDGRYVFLGTRTVDEPPGTTPYGARRPQDLVGIAERIGAFRWRIVMPAENAERITLYELVPVSPDLGDAS